MTTAEHSRKGRQTRNANSSDAVLCLLFLCVQILQVLINVRHNVPSVVVLSRNFVEFSTASVMQSFLILGTYTVPDDSTCICLLVGLVHGIEN